MYILKCYHNSVYAYDNIGSYIFKRVMGTVAMNILRHLLNWFCKCKCSRFYCIIIN